MNLDTLPSVPHVCASTNQSDPIIVIEKHFTKFAELSPNKQFFPSCLTILFPESRSKLKTPRDSINLMMTLTACKLTTGSKDELAERICEFLLAPEGEREEPDEEDDADDKDEEEEEQASSEEDTKKKKGGRRGNVEEKVGKGGRPRRATAGRTRGKLRFYFPSVYYNQNESFFFLFNLIESKLSWFYCCDRCFEW